MVFGIVDARGYRRKLEADVARFANDIASADLAINAVTFLYHFHEWLWRHNIKPLSPRTVRGEILRDKSDFVRWLDDHCPNFSLLQDLANGSKHAIPVHAGGAVEGFGQGPFGIGPYGRSYLLIDLGTGSDTDRYKVAHAIVSEAAEFMLELACELGA